jgi:hypothetical protein
VEDDHTFYVSDKPEGPFILTHNSLPDIDSDFADRAEAVNLITEYFGEENTIPVSNFAQLQIASLCKDLARIYGVPPEVVNSYTTKMRAEAMSVARREPGFDAATWEFTLEKARNNSPSYQKFMEEVKDFPEFKGALEVLFKQQRTCFPDTTFVLTDSGFKQLKNIKEGKDKVAYLDHIGEIKYNDQYEILNQGNKELIELQFSDGSKLELTPDHEVMTQNGYKKVDELDPTKDKIIKI